MKKLIRPSILTVLAAYLLVAAWPETSLADRKESKRLEAMAKLVAASYNSTDYSQFESQFDNLINEYQRLGRTQESIWAHYAADFDLKARAIEKDLKLKLQTDEIVSDEFLKGAARKVKLAGGNWAVIRVAGNPVPSILHDVIAYEIDRVLEWHLVPLTTIREYKGQAASIHSFIDDLTMGTIDFRKNAYTFERLHIFDFITQQLDRHKDNWGTAPDGHLVALDNDLMHGSTAWDQFNVYGMITAAKPPQTIRPENRAAVQRLKIKLADPNEFPRIPAHMKSAMLEKIEILLERPVACAHLLSVSK